jgi:type I restriction enzyme S subunit
MELPVSCPPPDVQQEIGAILGSADDKLDSNHRISRLLEEVVMASFASLFSVEPSECGVAVSDLIAVNPSRNLKKGTVATYIGMSDLPANSAIVPNWGRRPFGSGQRFRNGDVLMARITPCLENGKTAVVDMLDEGEVGWGSTEYVVLAPAGALSTPWVYCLARSEPVRTFAIRSMSGTSGRQRFSADAVDHYRIAAPTSGALKEFNSLAVPAFEIMAQLRDESRTLSVLRDALLPGLLTGRIPANAKVVGCES